MPKYTVEIVETLIKEVNIVADSREDAMIIAEENYNDGHPVLDAMDFFQAEFNIVDEEEDTKDTYLIHYSLNGDDRYKIVLETMEMAHETAFTLSITEGYVDVDRPLLVPDTILNVLDGELRLCPYETAYEFEPVWVEEHSKLWNK